MRLRRLTGDLFCHSISCSTTTETSMTKSPQRRDGKKVGKTLKEKREAKRSKQDGKKLTER